MGTASREATLRRTMVRWIWIWGLWVVVAGCPLGARSEEIQMWVEVTPEGEGIHKVEVYLENTVPVGAFQLVIHFQPANATVVEPYPEKGPQTANIGLVKGNVPKPGELRIIGLDIGPGVIEPGKGVLVVFYIQSMDPVSLRFTDQTGVFDFHGNLIWRFAEEPKPSKNTWGKIKALFRF